MIYRNTLSAHCGLLTVVLCLLVFAGWQFDVAVLRSLIPGAPATTPLTALMLLLLGVALICAGGARTDGLQTTAWACIGLCAAVLALAAYTGMQYVFDLDPGIEIALYSRLVAEHGGAFPGRPSPQTALTATLLGGAIGLSGLASESARKIATVLLVAGLMVTWLVLFGYASTTNPFFAVPDNPETGMSPITAAGFLALIVGAVGLRPGEGLWRLLTAPTSGARLVRVLLPVVIVIPLLFGWIVTYGRANGLFDSSLGFALNWGVTSLLFAAMIIWQGNTLHRHDLENDRVAKEREKMLTDLEQATVKISRQAADLERSNQELKQFAYIASHDLQAPLRGISGFVQLLKEEYSGKLSADADDWIDRIIQSTLRMQTLIQDLLAYSRVDSQKTSFERVSVQKAFDEAVALLESPVMELSARITCDKLPVIFCNKARMTQLLQNLIGNSLKYHGEDPPEVHVSAEFHQSEWLFSVRDNGIGVDPKYHEKIFEVFSRLHSQKEYSGTGIGLAVCRRIVNQHGGRIWLESEPGKGSVFKFTIPIEENLGD